MNKFIFLDIDGVLNSLQIYHDDPKHAPNCHGLMGIENCKVKLLSQIVQATDAEIILVSSWKRCFVSYMRHRETKEVGSYDACGKYLYNKLSAEHLHIKGTTLNYEVNSGTRGQGIQAFLKAHPSDAWVVLDDEIFDDYETYDIISHLVKTNDYTGLTEENVQEAIKKLNE